MRNQEVIWTALPNGRQAGVFRLSVHVAPRLMTDEGLPDPRLQLFKDFMNWPANALKFEVKLGGGAPVAAKIVTAPQASNDLWTAVFNANTFVRPHRFDALLGRKVRSYPVRHIRTFVRDLYTQLVAASPTDHPDFDRLMSGGDGPRQRSFAELNFVDESEEGDRKSELLQQLENQFPFRGEGEGRFGQRWGAIPFNPKDPPVKSFLQLEKFHQPPPAIFRVSGLGAEGVREGRLVRWLVARGEAVALDQLLGEVQTAKGPVKLLSPWAGTVRSVNKPVGSTIRVGDPLLAEPGAPVAPAVTMTRDFVKKLDAFNKKPTLKDSGPEGAIDFHQMLSFAANHPTLMRLLGLVIDLEFTPVPPAPSGPSTVQVNAQWKPQLSTTKDFFPITRCLIDAAHFLAAPRASDPELVDGALPLENQDRYEIVEIDQDGVGLKTMHFADNLGRSRLSRHLTDDTPKSYAPPSLRSGGLSVARMGHATKLVESFQRSKNLNDSFKSAPIVLDAEDVTRGFVAHVWDSKTAKWHSLTQRMGTYEFLNKPETVKVEDEAAIIIGPTSSFEGSTTDLYQQETLFRWPGWSLAAPRPGKAMVLDPAHDTGGHSQRIESVAAEDFRLQLRFQAAKGSLPRLRFGVQYRIRARGVDLAGNRLDFGDPKAPDPHATRRITYARFEPVEGPFLLLRLPRTMGESVERMVIRSNFNEAAAADNQRHLSPPKTSQLMAEEHGLFDTAAGIDHNAFRLIGARENESYQTSPQGKKDPLDIEDSRYFDVDQLNVPFLPDPLARGAALRGLPGRPAGDVLLMRFLPSGKAWPEFANIRIILEEGTASKSEPRSDGRVLLIVLPKAEVVTVRYSCFLNLNDLAQMGIWLWLDEKVRKQLEAAAVTGQVWALTPARELVLVHAVRQPLKTPEFDRLAAGKVLGQTFATLGGPLSFSRKSTATVKVFASWPEAIDEGPGAKDPTLPPHPEQKGFAFDVPLDVGFGGAAKPPEDQVTFGALKHEFHDTKYRRVTYNAVASTKFGEYFAKRVNTTLTGTAEKLIDNAGFVPGTVRVTAGDGTATFNLNKDYTLDYAKGTIARLKDGSIKDGDPVRIVYQHPPTTRETEKPVTLDILNSARPAAPKVLYVLPTWGFTQKKGARGTVRSHRRGGGLRVYMDRPWWSSGEGEMLGVVLFRPVRFFQFQPPDPLKPYVTQWGVDPIHSTGSTSLFPTLDRFPLREVEPERLVTLDERPAGELVRVAGHQVDFDPERKLWFCDIDVITDRSYWPFIRLALARYQPKSLTDAHISRVVMADFAQVAPDRSVIITFNSGDATRFRVTVIGLSYTGRKDAGGTFRGGPGLIQAHIEQRSDKFGGELAWMPLGSPVTLTSSPLQGGGTIWERDMQLPRRKWPFRLVLEETEPLGADPRPFDGDVDKPVQRLVFTDVLPLTPDEIGVVSVSPAGLDFKEQLVGTKSADQTVTVKNAGNAPLRIGDIRIVGPNAADFAKGADGASGKTLNPGDSATVQVRFAPTDLGRRSAQLAVPSDGVGTGQVDLAGVGINIKLELNPSSLDFGSQQVGVASDPLPVSISNAGNVDLKLGTLMVDGPHKADFAIVADCSGAVVKPGDKCQVTLRFTPGALGSRSASLRIPSNAPSSPDTVPLSGTGGVALPGVTPTSIDFGDQRIGTVEAQLAVVANGGNAPLRVTKVEVVGPDQDAFLFFSEGLPGKIPPGGTVPVWVVYIPSNIGPQSASLRIQHDAPGKPPLTVPLKGNGTTPLVVLIPTSLDFGSQRVGTDSAPKTVTIMNGGNADLDVASVDFEGPAAGDYAISAVNGSLPIIIPGGTTSFEVIFSPSSPGARNAVLKFSDDAPDSPQSVPITGKGLAPAVTVTPSSLDFGRQAVGTVCEPRKVTVKNTGDADLHVSFLDLSGDTDDFPITADDCTGATLAPGATCTAEIVFAPLVAGTRTAVLLIMDDAADSPQRVNLRGVGEGPPAF